MLQSLTDIQRRMHFGDQVVIPKGSKSSTIRRKRSPSDSFDSKGSTDSSSSSSNMNERKRRYHNHSCDEFKKASRPTFNGEVKNGQDVEACLLGMRKYFQVQDYSGNMKARVAIYNFTGRASMWWEHLDK